MRLLFRRSDGAIAITKYLAEDELPRYEYAILSHTWQPDNDDEISFRDLGVKPLEEKPKGYAKMQFCADQAAKDGLKYFWMDTCCINKDSSEELQEAITMMFTWYRNAAKCYAYLTDVSVTTGSGNYTDEQVAPYLWEPAFRGSRWFTRGWTLQELLAPKSVEFFSAEGTRLGDKQSLRSCIFEITGISHNALRGDDLSKFSVTERMSWSENRSTKRKEDRAYCLLGIFNVYIPHIYGEGDHAFDRLREAIAKKQAEVSKQEQVLSTLPLASGAAFDSPNNQREPQCLSNTRAELLQSIDEWVSEDDERYICWLNGMAGTGKSTVARTIASTYHDRGKLGASFFFSRGSGNLGTAKRFVTSIAQQLATTVPSIRRYICEAVIEQNRVEELPLREQWDHLIIKPLVAIEGGSCPSPLVIVVDALDECDNESHIRDILRILATGRSLKHTKLRILLSSRPELPIRIGFRDIPEAERHILVLHEASPTLVDRDIRLFFDSHFSIMRNENALTTEWPGERKIKTLVENSCGLFIWASTACRFIRGDQWPFEQRISMLINQDRACADPERQLDQIYVTVLQDSVSQRFNNMHRTVLHKLLRETLGRIVVLYSPLSMDSLASLLDRPVSDIQETLKNFHTIFRIPSRTSLPIHLHHPTFRDFLLDRSRCSGLDFWVDEKQIQQGLARCCLTYMSRALEDYVDNSSPPCSSDFNNDYTTSEQHDCAALRYACLYWVEHCRKGGLHLTDGDEFHTFFEQHFTHWLEVMNIFGKISEAGAIMRIYHSLLAPSDNPRQLLLVKRARKYIVQSSTRLASTQISDQSTLTHSTDKRRRDSFLRHPPVSHIWNDVSSTSTVKDESNYVNDLVFTRDGKHVATGSNFEAVRVWDVTSKAAVCKFEAGFREKVSTVAISPDGKLIAAGSDDFTVVVWNISTGRVLHTLKSHYGWVNSVVFSPNGEILASGSMDETITLWDTKTGRELGKLKNDASCVNSLTFSSDSSLIATGSVDQTIRIWNVAEGSGKLHAVFHGHEGCVNSVKFSPDGSHLLSGSDDMTMKLWDKLSGRESLTFSGHSKRIMAVAFSVDARLVVSGSEDMTVRIWDASNGAPLRTLRGHTSGINAVSFSRDGTCLASGSFDDEVRLWDTKASGDTAMWAPLGALEEFKDSISSNGIPGDMDDSLDDAHSGRSTE